MLRTTFSLSDFLDKCLVIFESSSLKMLKIAVICSIDLKKWLKSKLYLSKDTPLRYIFLRFLSWTLLKTSPFFNRDFVSPFKLIILLYLAKPYTNYFIRLD